VYSLGASIVVLWFGADFFARAGWDFAFTIYKKLVTPFE